MLSGVQPLEVAPASISRSSKLFRFLTALARQLARCASLTYTEGQMLTPADLSRLATALGGLPILGCLEGSPAERAGIRYGDILLSVNGMPTASWTDFFQARRRSAGQISVRVFRQGTEFEVTMDLPPTSRSPREVLDELQRRELFPRDDSPETPKGSVRSS